MTFEEPLFEDQDEAMPPFRVFVSHGKSLLWKEVAAFIEKQLEVEVTGFDANHAPDLTEIEALDQASEDASHAVVVVAEEDDRERAIQSIGYFQGVYGPNNVVVLRQAGVPVFSGIAGTIEETFKGTEIRTAFARVAEEIEASQAEYEEGDEED